MNAAAKNTNAMTIASPKMANSIMLDCSVK
jgi:hypothetical protein